jgi:dethiobiotin synthetase
MKKFFITGTDTNVGKTVISAILTMALDAFYWKPIQSGLAEDPREQEIIQTLTGIDNSRCLPSSYAFQAGLAIDQAAALENEVVDLVRCELPNVNHHFIVEGAGGVFHPLNASVTMFDLMKKINLPVIIVCRGEVGTINHSLLTIEALRQRDIEIHGVIFSGTVRKESRLTIERMGNVRTLLQVPHFTSLNTATVQDWVRKNQLEILENLQ